MVSREAKRSSCLDGNEWPKEPRSGRNWGHLSCFFELLISIYLNMIYPSQHTPCYTVYSFCLMSLNTFTFLKGFSVLGPMEQFQSVWGTVDIVRKDLDTLSRNWGRNRVFSPCGWVHTFYTILQGVSLRFTIYTILFNFKVSRDIPLIFGPSLRKKKWMFDYRFPLLFQFLDVAG